MLTRFIILSFVLLGLNAAAAASTGSQLYESLISAPDEGARIKAWNQANVQFQKDRVALIEFIILMLNSPINRNVDDVLDLISSNSDEIKMNAEAYRKIRPLVMNKISAMNHDNTKVWFGYFLRFRDLTDKEFLSAMEVIERLLAEEHRQHKSPKASLLFNPVIKALGDNSYERLLAMAESNPELKHKIEKAPLRWLGPTEHPDAAVKMFSYLREHPDASYGEIDALISQITDITRNEILGTPKESQYSTFADDVFNYIVEIADTSRDSQIRMQSLLCIAYMGTDGEKYAPKAADIITKHIDFWKTESRSGDLEKAFQDIMAVEKAREEAKSNPKALDEFKKEKAKRLRDSKLF